MTRLMPFRIMKHSSLFYKMAALEMPANGEQSQNFGEEVIQKALDSIEDQQQKVCVE